MKNILIQLKTSWINTKLRIKNFLITCTVTILYILIITAGIILHLLYTIISVMTISVRFIKDISSKDKLMTKFNKLKSDHAILLEQHTTLINALKSRLSQDCFSKRFITRICAIINKIKSNSNFQFSRI